jgi:NADH-quinone oxidoreductase subunit E
MSELKRKSDLLSDHEKKEIDHWLAKYPEDQRQSAVLAALRELMHTDGYLKTEKMDAVADYIGMPEISVYEVGSFYSMYETKPVGRHNISVCTNVSCMLCGSDKIVEHIESKLGIKTGESTPDGKFYLKKEEECLAACCGAPMMQVNHVYYENLTPEKVDEILDNLE